MEMAAAYKLWSRSENMGFRYTTILSDGDAKAFKYLNEKNIYGADTEIKKEERVNHVTKDCHVCKDLEQHYAKLLKNGELNVSPLVVNHMEIPKKKRLKN
ncbi:hypothetical protein AVEN_251917-1 [Araneus ventricosus]|uniref:Mutator-like transposase domain-containing protein n=1 Tax=Araneus ventricosus TaxID=182803 RepID=A0A4Y2GZQ2_ARAVE|nr:hypothetical protein AVEN_251917-1 [Araneus ventricosus]